MGTQDDLNKRAALEAMYKKFETAKSLLQQGWHITFFDNVPSKEMIYYLTHPSGLTTRLAVSWEDLIESLKGYPEINEQYRKLIDREEEILQDKIKLLHMHLMKVTRRT
jgi:hypothetical protein